MREANERLVVASLHADEIADELRTSRDAWRASEIQFRTLANSIPMMAWYANPEGDIAWCNDRCSEYTGKTIEELVGSQWEPVLDPDDLPRITTRWRAALASGTPWEDVFRLRRRDGAMRWFLARALPLRDDAGNIVRWFGTTADIDDQKRAEDRARASDRAKDEFLAMLGHELRNPLSPIMATLDLMQLRDPKALAHERAIIQRQVSHLARLVDDLLDVSRINQGKIVLQCEPIELGEVVTRAVEMVRPLAEKKQHDLIVSVPAGGLVVDADPTRLAQAIGNLLNNAAKYTPPRGTIEVTGEARDSIVALRVRDTGIGISATMLPHVFELFAQEQQALDRSQGGLGLGLTIVQRLVAMHGGTVTAASEGLGRGSTFTIELPRWMLPIAAGAPQVAADLPIDMRGLKVLVVDDNRPVAESFGEVLVTFGCEVRVAFDARTALAIARDFVPDVAMLDIGLPGMDGYELASRLRAQASRQPRLVAITGYGQPEDIRRAHDAGFAAHLVKPVRMAQIEAMLRQISTPPAGRV